MNKAVEPFPFEPVMWIARKCRSGFPKRRSKVPTGSRALRRWRVRGEGRISDSKKRTAS